jgi:hypothetical protein
VFKKVLVSCIAVVMGLLLVGVVSSYLRPATPRPTNGPVASYTPPIEEYISRIKERTRIGDEQTATLELPCASTQGHLEEITTAAARGQARQAALTLLGTNSTMLSVGDKYKVLALDLHQAKIRILNSGKECWVPSFAMR